VLVGVAVAVAAVRTLGVDVGTAVGATGVGATVEPGQGTFGKTPARWTLSKSWSARGASTCSNRSA